MISVIRIVKGPKKLKVTIIGESSEEEVTNFKKLIKKYAKGTE